MKDLKFLFVVACGGFLAVSFASQGVAGDSFDGSWRVSASAATPNPRCPDRSVSLLVEDGNVKYAGFLSSFVSGTVKGDGKLIARIAKIRVSGKLADKSGSGAWRSPNCTGTWTAHRE